ncbi:MAG: tRNA uridine-5-carboxymethylaminomethyl(34) synthesis GTPase MnmE [Spirochaetaceae bacterium]|jgi:tRNA modification GTPase|nr:tRNA uridine-5-carboxymethylaminomethyl(34) synthesis GTPase MnmE [Spirochaetaceae bacterium]
MRTYGDDCPIAVQAAGQGALALIRTGGRGTLELMAGIFSRPRALLECPGNTVVHGWIMDKQEKIDEVLISVYRAPRSYTGEEGADISCHGGTAAARAILEALRKAGFQDSLPGEFTFRAFMNGKMDLTRCESVMELVSAKTGEALGRAVRRLAGALEREIKEIRNKLLEVLSAVELYLDYPEDELDSAETAGAAEPGDFPRREAAEEVLGQLRSLAASYRREHLYQEGALAVIAGKPNAGKSSLFNALLHEDRSIVTEIPGTTRDWIEASISLDGIPLRLADTAGLREPKEDDPAEARGIEKSKELIGGADLVLYVIDGSAGIDSEDKAFIASCRKNQSPGEGLLLLLWNKADVAEPPKSIRKEYPDLTVLSAAGGTGLEELCHRMKSLLMDTPALEKEHYVSAGLGARRQKELTEKAIRVLEEALHPARREEPLDLIAPLLREAVDALGEITGEVSTGDILEIMFSRFCLGK